MIYLLNSNCLQRVWRCRKWRVIKYLKKKKSLKSPFGKCVLSFEICGTIKKQLFITLTLNTRHAIFRTPAGFSFPAYCSFPWWRLTHRVELCLTPHCAFIETGTSRYHPVPCGKPSIFHQQHILRTLQDTRGSAKRDLSAYVPLLFWWVRTYDEQQLSRGWWTTRLKYGQTSKYQLMDSQVAQRKKGSSHFESWWCQSHSDEAGTHGSKTGCVTVTQPSHGYLWADGCGRGQTALVCYAALWRSISTSLKNI